MAVKKDIPRQVVVKIAYAKKVKSRKAGGTKKRPAAVMAEYNEGFTYTDPASGESDTISITLTNTDLRWAKKWIPKRGDKLTAKIIEKSWDKAGQEKTFFCGKFCLDDISYRGRVCPRWECFPQHPEKQDMEKGGFKRSGIRNS